MIVVILIVAIVAGGALIAAQGAIYTRMADDLGGPLQAAMFAFGIGTLSLCLLLAATGGPVPRRDQFAEVPFWVWAGGLIGVYVVLTSIVAVPRLGITSYMVCVISGQLTASCLYDQYGAFGIAVRTFSTVNVIGLMLVFIGAGLVLWR